MKRIFLLLLLLVTIFLISCTNENIVCFKECYPVEIADTPEERSLGLMFRESLEDGMLFVYSEPGKHDFWMKNTLIPLDIIWMNENLEVIYITQAEPCKTEECPSYGPDKDSMYVIELNIDSGIEIGDVMRIKSHTPLDNYG